MCHSLFLFLIITGNVRMPIGGGGPSFRMYMLLAVFHYLNCHHSGFIPLSQLLESRDKVSQKGIELQESFLNHNDINRKFSLRHYFKFMMVHNPLHRLVSGYRSNVQCYPLTGLNDSKPHYNFLRKAIYLQMHPKECAEFLRKRGRAEIILMTSLTSGYCNLRRLNLMNIFAPCTKSGSLVGRDSTFMPT